jgi:hypothetical protein
MGFRGLGIAVGVAGLAVCAVATGAAASGTAAAGPSWHEVKSVATGVTGGFSAVVASGTASGWAFDGIGAPKGPTAWKWNGASWTKVAFPGKANEEVTAAAAASPSDVWAADDNIFQTGSRLIRWNGHGWSAVKSFPGGISGLSVVTANDVWVFGELASPGIPGIGVWHWNGKKWAHVSTSFQGGSALNWNNVWAYNGTSVEHWNGAKWVGTSVKGLLPPALKSHLNDPTVTGILALSASNVFAVGNGNQEDEGGPTVVLHYNGHTWSKLAEGQFGLGAGQQLSTDGSGGLWLPMPGVDGESSFVVHYSAGKLTKAALPIAAGNVYVGSVARVPGTTEQLAGGFSHAKGNDGGNIVGVILEYSPHAASLAVGPAFESQSGRPPGRRSWPSRLYQRRKRESVMAQAPAAIGKIPTESPQLASGRPARSARPVRRTRQGSASARYRVTLDMYVGATAGVLDRARTATE